VPHFTLVKEALIEIGCVVTSLVGWLVVGWNPYAIYQMAPFSMTLNDP